MATRPPMSCAPVVVIGAGSAGLAVAAAAQRRGRAVIVLEQGEHVGTSWRDRYAELRLNTTRATSHLSGGGLPRSVGRWPGRDDFVRHLETFAAREKLDVHFGVQVRRIDRAPGGWTVRGDGDLEAAHVVVATGRARVPHMPDWSGRADYRGRLLHVADLARVADLDDGGVLVVGGGNSGVDLAGQLAEAGVGPLWLSVRTPPSILPLQFAGVPVQPLGVVLRHFPERFRDVNARTISGLVLGDLTAFGLPAPAMGPYARLRTTGVTTAVDRGFTHHLKAGRVTVVADVDWFTADEVVLRDGRRLRPGVVVATTGFRPGLEALVGHLGVLDERGLPRTGPGRAAPGAAGLWFAGFWPAIEGDLRRHPIEARQVARRIAVGVDRHAGIYAQRHREVRHARRSV